MPDFIRETKRVARKEHQCSDCGETIHPGEEYQHVTGKWEGGIATFKTCEICQLIRKSGVCAYFGELRQTIMDCWGFDYTTDPATWPEPEGEPS
jgi:hypothetical protein